jgi:hypothetical protein
VAGRRGRIGVVIVGDFHQFKCPARVRIVSPADGQTLPHRSISISPSRASDPDGTIAKVEFYFGSEKIAEDIAELVAVKNDNPSRKPVSGSARQPGGGGRNDNRGYTEGSLPDQPRLIHSDQIALGDR